MPFRLPSRSVARVIAILMLGIALGVPLGILLSAAVRLHPFASPGSQEPEPIAVQARQAEPPNMDLYWEAWGTVHSEFVNRAALDDQHLVYGAIRGMVASLGDPYTMFQTPDERQAEMTAFSGRFQGIGTYIDAREGRIVILGAIEGSPAARAGVQPGDVVLSVDGQDVGGLTLQQVSARVRGPKGSVVKLLLLRGTETVELAVERDEIPLISARGSVLEPGIGLLRMTSFTERSDAEVAGALDSLSQQSVNHLVLDLRGNAGGLLEPAVEVASRLTTISPIVWQENGEGQRYAYERRNDRPALDWPMVVLVDRGSASASEVLAAALRDAGRATLVGQRTYGKGTVQYLHELSDGAGLRVTAARWISPAGTQLDQGGLDPDVPVTEPRTDDSDPAMTSALQLLRAVPASSR
ncbi:MAG TPA: S41 family peptidase [Chloroflexota bacterium]|jgi:carboxyl-terminal processing protease|nr:S41 family peptidase [Chloroflexota bacterium]